MTTCTQNSTRGKLQDAAPFRPSLPDASGGKPTSGCLRLILKTMRPAVEAKRPRSRISPAKAAHEAFAGRMMRGLARVDAGAVRA
jgi:hypothetical protein